jgi:hypothetical protein
MGGRTRASLSPRCLERRLSPGDGAAGRDLDRPFPGALQQVEDLLASGRKAEEHLGLQEERPVVADGVDDRWRGQSACIRGLSTECARGASASASSPSSADRSAFRRSSQHAGPNRSVARRPSPRGSCDSAAITDRRADRRRGGHARSEWAAGRSTVRPGVRPGRDKAPATPRDAPAAGWSRRAPRAAAPRPRERPGDGALHARRDGRARPGSLREAPSREALERARQACPGCGERKEVK